MAQAVSSTSPIVSATDVFLIVFRNSDVDGGRMIRNAVAAEHIDKVCGVVSPIAAPASSDHRAVS